MTITLPAKDGWWNILVRDGKATIYRNGKIYKPNVLQIKKPVLGPNIDIHRDGWLPKTK